jgi:hypothetical protein
METQILSKYINDFLYFVITPDQESANGDIICSSGVNVDRFSPITKGRHKPMQNPAIRGLQLLQYDIMALALEHGTVARPKRGYREKGVPPTEELWVSECTIIKNPPASFPDELINRCVIELLNKINQSSSRGATIPDTLPGSDELQQFLEALCDEYSKEEGTFFTYSKKGVNFIYSQRSAV